MACDRPGCSNVMCDHCINNQYICSDCIEEFIAKNTQLRTREKWSAKFDKFMQTQKPPEQISSDPDLISSADFFFKESK